MTTPTPSPAPQWAKDAAIDYLGNPGGSMTDEDTMYHQCDIDDLAAIITKHAAAISEERWTEAPPTEQGTYWHWNGDEDCAPLPMFVLWSGTTGKCFVSRGQLGIEDAIDCDQYGGWWMPLMTPPIPSLQSHPAATNLTEEGK